MLNLDTHIFLFALSDQLTQEERTHLSKNRWSISAIVLWEIAKLVQLGRVKLNLDDPEFRRVLGQIHIWPIDFEVCRQSTRLDFTSDPADELIAATSMVHSVPLLTRDTIIKASKLVPMV
jgi:PIN domain nuclease of toxin-antitoxin system